MRPIKGRDDLLEFRSISWKETPPAGIKYSPFLLGKVNLKIAVEQWAGAEDSSLLIYRQSPWQLSVYVALGTNKENYMEVPLDPGDTADTFIARIAECVRMLRALSEKRHPTLCGRQPQ